MKQGEKLGPMTVEDAIKMLGIKITEHAPGPPKYRMGEMGQKVRIFETISRVATPADVLAFNEERGTLVTCDGKKYCIF